METEAKSAHQEKTMGKELRLLGLFRGQRSSHVVQRLQPMVPCHVQVTLCMHACKSRE